MQSDVWGVENLAKVDGNVQIYGNVKLANSSGISKQACLGGSLNINLNNVLPDTTRLSMVAKIDEDVQIQGNGTLVRIDDLNSPA